VKGEFLKYVTDFKIINEIICWGDPGVDERIILRWIFRKWDVGYGLESAGSGYRQVVGSCECGNEPSGSIKCGEFFDWLQTN
jgi:hypothetical protein